METMSELDKLGEYLVKKGYNCTRRDKSKIIYGCEWGIHQIIVFDDDGNRLWDAICHRGSYGYEDGLLEIMGTIVDPNKTGEDTVEGWLTAQDVISRLEAISGVDDGR